MYTSDKKGTPRDFLRIAGKLSSEKVFKNKKNIGTTTAMMPIKKNICRRRV